MTCTGDRDQDHPHGKEMQKGKMVAWGGLTNSHEMKRSEKQREKERYSHLNAESQRIARRDKKAFLSDQCKEREENNRMGNIRDLFKKIRDIKGIFHTKMGSIKGRNGTNLTKAKAIKKRWEEYTENLYKKRSSWFRYSQWWGHSPRARYPGMWSQVGLGKHHYEQS